MTPAVEQQLLALIANPPPGSAIAEAIAYGVDLTLALELLKLTPSQRFQRAEDERAFVADLREAGRKARL